MNARHADLVITVTPRCIEHSDLITFALDDVLIAGSIDNHQDGAPDMSTFTPRLQMPGFPVLLIDGLSLPPGERSLRFLAQRLGVDISELRERIIDAYR